MFPFHLAKRESPSTFRLNAVTVVLGLTTFSAAAQTAGVGTHGPERADQEIFLKNAAPVRIIPLRKGVTNSRRVTLSDGTMTHDAHLQSVDIRESIFQGSRGVEFNFRDRYTFNVAAYRLDKLLGLGMVPVTVKRRIRRASCALTWWVDDVLMDERERIRRRLRPPDTERWAKQYHLMRIFDALIYNTDRNQGNLLITTDWRIWLIDHTRAFRTYLHLPEKERITRCDGALLEKLRALRREDVDAALGSYLTKGQIAALLRRRELLIEHFDSLILERGEQTVLFTRP